MSEIMMLEGLDQLTYRPPGLRNGEGRNIFVMDDMSMFGDFGISKATKKRLKQKFLRFRTKARKKFLKTLPPKARRKLAKRWGLYARKHVPKVKVVVKPLVTRRPWMKVKPVVVSAKIAEAHPVLKTEEMQTALRERPEVVAQAVANELGVLEAAESMSAECVRRSRLKARELAARQKLVGSRSLAQKLVELKKERKAQRRAEMMARASGIKPPKRSAKERMKWLRGVKKICGGRCGLGYMENGNGDEVVGTFLAADNFGFGSVFKATPTTNVRTAAGYERKWPSIKGNPIKPTTERVAAFNVALEQDVARTGRWRSTQVRQKAVALGNLARRHAKIASQIAKQSKVVKADMKVTKAKLRAELSPSNKVILAAKIKRLERYNRALTVKFGTHGVMAQKAVMASSVLTAAQKVKNAKVRAKVVAAAEAIEKTPEKIELKAKKPLPGIPSTNELIKHRRVCEELVVEKGRVDKPLERIVGLGLAKEEADVSLDELRAGVTSYGYGTGLGQAFPDLYPEQLDARGRPAPGPSPTDAWLVDYIQSGFTEIGDFSDFEGWWSRYKKRAKQRMKQRTARWKEKSKKKLAAAGKRLATAAGKAAGEAVVTAGKAVVEKASEVIEEGINKGLQRVGESPEQTVQAAEQVAEQAAEAAPPTGAEEPGEPGSKMPGWLLPVGIAAAIGTGAYMMVRKGK